MQHEEDLELFEPLLFEEIDRSPVNEIRLRPGQFWGCPKCKTIESPPQDNFRFYNCFDCGGIKRRYGGTIEEES